MSDVEVGMENCLDELSFHNILAVMGVGHYWIAGKDRVSCFVPLDMQSVNSKEDRCRQLTCAPFTVFI